MTPTFTNPLTFTKWPTGATQVEHYSSRFWFNIIIGPCSAYDFKKLCCRGTDLRAEFAVAVVGIQRLGVGKEEAVVVQTQVGSQVLDLRQLD